MTAHTVLAQQLRDIADFVSVLPDDVETPTVDSTGVTFYVFGYPLDDDPQARTDRVADVLGGLWEEEELGPDDRFIGFRSVHTLAGRPVRIVGFRGQVTAPAPVPEAVAS